jgi:hypothetical protein
MRKRMPAALIKRVEKLEKDRGQQKCRPVAMFPRLVVSVDEWAALAAPMQERLKVNVKDIDRAVDYSDLPKLELVASS